MTDPPPHPDRWSAATLHLQPGEDGHYGRLTYAGGIVIYVRRWRLEGGLVRFEAQHQADAEMAAWVGEG